MQSLKLAVTSIMQFSTKPLRLATYTGLVAALFSVGFGMWTLFEHFYLHKGVSGYTSIVSVIVFVSSIQLIMIGILGEYIGKIHIEVKKRPLYFADLIETK